MTHIKNRVEIRTCIRCGETKEIVQKNKCATNICLECRNIASREYAKVAAIKRGQRIGQTGRVPYPLNEGFSTPQQKFRSMARKMIKMKDRDEWVSEMRINLERAFLNKEVMDWINAHSDDVKLKRPEKIKDDYPSTKGMTWEEYAEGLGSEDVDS